MSDDWPEIRRSLLELAGSDWCRFLSIMRNFFTELARRHDKCRSDGADTAPWFFVLAQWRDAYLKNEVEIDGVVYAAAPVGAAELPTSSGPRKVVFLVRSAQATLDMQFFGSLAELMAESIPRQQIDSTVGAWPTSTALAEWLTVLWMRRSPRYGEERPDGWLWQDIFRASIELVDVLAEFESKERVSLLDDSCGHGPGRQATTTRYVGRSPTHMFHADELDLGVPTNHVPSKDTLLDTLKRLPAAQFEELVFHLDGGSAVPGRQAPQVDRAIELLRLVSVQSDGLLKLQTLVARLTGAER